MLTHPIDCPACGKQHASEYRLGQWPLLACPAVTPTGNVLILPRKGVCVVGAGLWVDESPAVELTPAQLEARIASLKTAQSSASPMPASGKSVDDLKKELAELEGR